MEMDGGGHMHRTGYRSPVDWGKYAQKGRHPPPALGWGRRPYGFAVGIAPVATGAWECWGVSPAAAGEQGRCPLDPCDFLKKIE